MKLSNLIDFKNYTLLFKQVYLNNFVRFYHYTETPTLKCPQCYYIYSKDRYRVKCLHFKSHKQSQKKPPKPQEDRFQLLLLHKQQKYIRKYVKKPWKFIPKPYGSFD